jgi:hypothetical protein
MAEEALKQAPGQTLPAADLRAPTVEFATANNTLDPMLVQRGTVVTIEFDSLTSEHRVQLYWEGPEGPGRPFFPVQDGSDAGSIQIPVAAGVIGACIGKTVDVWFTATRDNTTETSLKLELTVETIDPQALPAPTFLDVVTYEGGRWLDMRKFDGDARIALRHWPFIAAGQRLWILAVGNEHHAGNFRFKWVLEGHRVTESEAQGGDFLEHLQRDWLAGCEDYSSVTMSVAVTFDGAPGTAPSDPGVSLLPANALELRRTSENLRVGEPELKLLAPRVVEATECGTEGCLLNPINATDGATIRVTYNGMRESDRVCAFFTGTPGNGTPSLACVYGMLVGFVDIEVPVSAIGANFCQQVRVHYTVLRDEVLWPSRELKLTVLNITDLPSPELVQATGAVLDLNTFIGDADALVQAWWYIAEGQPTWLWVTGELEDGTPYSFDMLSGEPLPTWSGDIAIDTVVPRHELEKLADCTGFEVHFAVNFNGQIDHPSAVEFPLLALTLHQQDLQLEAPTVRQAVGGLLNPENAKKGVTVRVAYDRISPRHTIQPHWVRPDGSSLPIDARPGDSITGHVDFTVPFNEVIACIGKIVRIGCSVTSTCQEATSAYFFLVISVPRHWPKPNVLEATQDILDVRNMKGDGTVVVKPWSPWMVVGQRVWLGGSGTDKDGNTVVLDLIAGELVTEQEVSEGLKRILPRTWLESLKDFSVFSLFCKVTLDGSTDIDRAIVLAPLQLTVRLLFDDLTTFDDGDWNGWQRGADMRPVDLFLRLVGETGHLISDHADKPAGELLTKHFENLQVNVIYEFSFSFRRRNTVAPIPRLSLHADSTTVLEPTSLAQTSWQTIAGCFVATRPAMQLWMESYESANDGNDFEIDNIRLREL